MPFQISLLDAKIHARVRRPVFAKSVNALMTKTNLESIVVKSIEVDKKDKGVGNNKDLSKNECFKRNQHVLEKENSDSVAIRSDQNEKGSVKILRDFSLKTNQRRISVLYVASLRSYLLFCAHRTKGVKKL